MRTERRAILRAVRVWLVFAIVLSVCSPALAARRPALHWTRAASAAQCIDPLTLAERIEALTGPVFLPPADYAIEGHVERRGDKFVAHVGVTGSDRAPQGERVIEQSGPDCHALDESVVFVIALMIDPDLDLERLAREPSLEGRTPGDELLRELEAHPPRPIELGAVKEEPTIAPPSPTDRYRWEGIAALAMGSDVLRGASLGPLLGLRFPVMRWFDVGAQLRLLPRLRNDALEAGRSVQAQTFSLAPLVCARPPGERVSLRVCAGPESSIVRARGRGFDAAQRANLHVWGLLAVGELALRVNDRWALLLHAYLRGALEDKRFTYGSSPFATDVVPLARLTAGVALGVTYRFGSGTLNAAGTHP